MQWIIKIKPKITKKPKKTKKTEKHPPNKNQNKTKTKIVKKFIYKIKLNTVKFSSKRLKRSLKYKHVILE